MTIYMDTDDKYRDHILMANNSPIFNDDWVYDTGAQVPMAKKREFFVKYHSLIKP